MGWFRSPKSSGQTTPDFTGLQLQTSVNTLPVPIVWGLTKIAPNLFWYSNFLAHDAPASGGGGKGFFSPGATPSTQGTTYSADLMLALCEGPIAGVGQVWKDQSVTSLAALGLSFFNGATPQTTWGYLASVYPGQALPYQGTAYVAAASYNLGANAAISNHNFEIQGLRYATGINGKDADPALCFLDFLTNAQFGVGLDPQSINTATLTGASGDASLQTYCRAMGIAFSPALTSQEQASSILTRWLQLTNCAAVWSGAQLKFIPYADAPVTGNGFSFVADTTAIYSLTDDDFVDIKGQDPVQSSRADPFALPTVQYLEVMDRSNQYALVPVPARDQSQIDLYGTRVGSTVTAHEICDVTVVGPVVAQLILHRALYVREQFTFKLPWNFCLLEPMDIVELTDLNLGLAAFPVRIQTMEEDEQGVLTFTAEEFVTGLALPVLYPTLSASSSIPDFNAAPGNINPPTFFEPPDQLGHGLNVMFGISPVDPANWGGCVVHVSADGADNFVPIGFVKGATRMGVLTAPLPGVAASPTGVTIDAVNVLAVDLSESDGSLAGGTPADMSAFNTACLVDGEIVAYQNATLTGANAYNLSPLARGGYGTTIAPHNAGAKFMRIEGGNFVWNYTSDRIGQTLYFKFASFNMMGLQEQSLADIGAYAYTITGAALASALPDVTDLHSNFEGGFQKIFWVEVDDFRKDDVFYEIRQGATWAGALLIRTQAHPPFIAQGLGTFWVAAKVTPATGLTIYSTNPQSIEIAGNQLALNLVASVDEQAVGWPGTLDLGVGTDGVGANKFLRLASAADILAAAPFLQSVAASAPTPSGNVLHFASVPAWVVNGVAAADVTTAGRIPAKTTVIGKTSNSVTLSANVSGGGVLGGDAITFSIGDVLNAGGIPTNTPFYYTSKQIIDVGYVAQASINVTTEVVGVPIGQDMLSVPNILATPDVLGSASTAFVKGWAEIRIAQSINPDVFALPDVFDATDAFAGGFAWGAWQRCVPGVQLGRAFQFRLALETIDPNSIPYALKFNHTVQAPGRIDHYQNQSVPPAGLAIVFAPDGVATPGPFNAGPAANDLPYVNVSWPNTAGDVLVITGLSLAGVTIAFTNGGVGVTRAGVNIDVEGF